jgi:hypothetical protein
MSVGGGILALLRDIYSYLELGQGSDVPRQHVVSKCKSLIPSNQMDFGEKLLRSEKAILSLAAAAFNAACRRVENCQFSLQR